MIKFMRTAPGVSMALVLNDGGAPTRLFLRKEKSRYNLYKHEAGSGASLEGSYKQKGEALMEVSRNFGGVKVR